MSGWTSEIKEKLWEKCLTGMVSFVCLIIAHSYCPLHSSSGSHASGSDSTGWPVFESTGPGPEVVWSRVSISVVRWRGDCCRPQLYVAKVCRLGRFYTGRCFAAALRCLTAPLPLDLLHRSLFVSGRGTVTSGLKGTVSPAGGLVPKRMQRHRNLAHGPNFRFGVNSIISTQLQLQNINSNSGGFNSNSNSNSGVWNPTPTPFQIQSFLLNCTTFTQLQ